MDNGFFQCSSFPLLLPRTDVPDSIPWLVFLFIPVTQGCWKSATGPVPLPGSSRSLSKQDELLQESSCSQLNEEPPPAAGTGAKSTWQAPTPRDTSSQGSWADPGSAPWGGERFAPSHPCVGPASWQPRCHPVPCGCCGGVQEAVGDSQGCAVPVVGAATPSPWVTAPGAAAQLGYDLPDPAP